MWAYTIAAQPVAKSRSDPTISKWGELPKGKLASVIQQNFLISPFMEIFKSNALKLHASPHALYSALQLRTKS